jgi:hypothetical protein
MQPDVRPARFRAAPALAPGRATSPQRRPVKQELTPPAAIEAQQVPLITVASSSVATSEDKSAVALVLKTAEAGPVAFQVTMEVCAVLRCQIAIAETLLNPKKARLGRSCTDSAAPSVERDAASNVRAQPCQLTTGHSQDSALASS